MGYERKLGLIFGGGLGTGIGAAIGDSVGSAGEGAAIGAGTGALLGYFIGGSIEARNETAVSEKSDYVIRIPLTVSDDQKQIDAMRRKMEDEAMFGGKEVKPWNERYWGENPNNPYQGPDRGSSF